MSCTGTCKKWFADRGFGFIAQDGADPNTDIFVHFSGITQPGRKSLNINEKVTFDLGSDAKSGKPRAENVSGDGTGKSSEELYPNKVNNQRGGGFGGNQQYGGTGGYSAYGGMGQQQQQTGAYGNMQAMGSYGQNPYGAQQQPQQFGQPSNYGNSYGSYDGAQQQQQNRGTYGYN